MLPGWQLAKRQSGKRQRQSQRQPKPKAADKQQTGLVALAPFD
jgi:hypothetical protein